MRLVASKNKYHNQNQLSMVSTLLNTNKYVQTHLSQSILQHVCIKTREYRDLKVSIKTFAVHPQSQSFSSRDKGDLDETLGGGGDPFTPKTSLPSPDRRNGPPGAGAAGHSRRQLDATNASANNSVGGSGVGDNIDTRGGANIGRRAQSNGAMRDNSAENSREVSLDGMAGEMITLTRPENFGVGAVDIRDGGGRRGGGEGVGLELPPIEEDQEYKKAMMRPDVEVRARENEAKNRKKFAKYFFFQVDSTW